MQKIVYISSTFEDLKTHREAVYNNLRGLPVQVKAMEDYVATDQRPLAKCLNDVASSQIYLGLFAWRYGYIPPRKNPKKQSITELEYRKAGATSGVERLVFLTREDHPWQPKFIDALTGESRSARQLERLRSELKEELMCDFFTTADNAAAKATAAVAMSLSRKSVAEFPLPEEITDLSVIREFGSTLTPEIVRKLKSAMDESAGSRVVEVDLGTGKTWWSSRLFLLAALAESFTEVEALMFVTGKGSLIGMATPRAVRRALARLDARLEDAYRRSLPGADQYANAPQDGVVHTAQNFRMHLGRAEKEIKIWVTRPKLREILGDDLNTAHVEVKAGQSPGTLDLLSQVLAKDTPLVALVEKGIPTRVMDRLGLGTSIATSGLHVVR